MQQPLFDDLPAKTTHDKTHNAIYSQIKPQLAALPWGDYMAEFIALGWPWRKAAFLAWSICPNEQRTPATKQEFAGLVAVNPATVSVWARDATIQAEILRIRAAELAEHDAEVIAAMLNSAKNPDHKHTKERILYWRLRGLIGSDGINANINIMMQQTGATNYEQMSEAELVQLAHVEQLEAKND